MKLTDHESKLLQRLEKEQKGWVKGKWMLLAMSVFFGVSFIYMISLAFSISFRPDANVGASCVIFAQAYLFLAMSFVSLNKFIYHFRGDPVKVLLLRIIKENRK